ncbi:MAG: hypothetical protein ACOCY7_01295 [Halodesulfurarchaeum sp.]
MPLIYKMAAQNGYSFAVCLSHDVDRIYKTYQSIYNILTDRDPAELKDFLGFRSPYWQFERYMAIESAHDVRSTFNILDEKSLWERPIREWFSKQGWALFAGRYDATDLQLASLWRVLDEFGWEIGLHGSYTSSDDPERFAYEKNRIESAAETEIIGNRQHWWRLSRPDTWRHLHEAGIKYDTSLGDSNGVEFEHGYELVRPFDDEFVVFPWSLMDHAVMDTAETLDGVWSTCERLLEDVRRNRSVMVLDWHSEVPYEREYPGYVTIYEQLIERALEMGAWVGPPGQFYRAIPHPDGTIDDALENLASEEPSGQISRDATPGGSDRENTRHSSRGR